MKTFEIIAATYEGFLIGYNFNVDGEAGSLVQSFASHDHSGTVHSLAVCSPYIATGGSDDRIIIYDFKLRIQTYMLTHHSSSVDCIDFTPKHSHIISGSRDGVLSITRIGNWLVEKIWDKAHKGSAIIDIAVHSSGKLALTLGNDSTLRTWNLVKGRQAFAVNLKSKSKDPSKLFKIVWAKDGVRFILFGGRYIEIWSIETGGILQCIEYDETFVCSCIWYSSKKILVGCNNGNIYLVKLSTLQKKTFTAHKERVKFLAKYNDWIVSGSSSGEIKVFNKEMEEICKVNSGSRLTSLAICEPVSVKKEEKDENILIENKETIILEEDEIKEEEKQEVTTSTKKNKKNKSKQRKIVKETNIEDSQINKEEDIANNEETVEVAEPVKKTKKNKIIIETEENEILAKPPKKKRKLKDN